MKWVLRGCAACGGDLHPEYDRDLRRWLWVCLMCGRSFPWNAVAAAGPPAPPAERSEADAAAVA